jgi:Tfp pilus assembly protein PilX
MKNRRGFILLLTLIFMTVLTVFTGALIYMATADMRSSAPQSDDVNLAGLADAGINIAHRAIRDDYLTTTSTGVADLRGATSSPANMQYIDGTNAVISTGTATVSVFDSNYANTRIISVVPYIKASRATGGQGATIQFAYTTNGSTYNTVLTQVLPSSTTLVDYAGTAISGLTWAQIMSPNFILRATRTTGNRNVNIDAMYLRVTYGIDTLKEAPATGSYATFPISLSGGTIESIAITDESGKAHLNYSSQSLLTNLFTNLGIASAATKAANIVNYRGASLSNPFDSVEELQQVTGITAADYAAIKNYVTVYSHVSSNVYRPAGSRAPININTASSAVLKSVFDSLGLGTGEAQSLANDIVTFRNSTPFTCFYSSNAAVTADFNHFIAGRSYLTATERNIVLDNCDASSLIPVSGYAGYNCTTTELCYAGEAFYIDVLARMGAINLRVKTLRGNDGSRVFSTYTTEPVSAYSGWRKENYE